MSEPGSTPSPHIRVRNLDSGRMLAVRAHVARTRRERAIGLLGQRGLTRGDGLWISPTRGVHTCGMRFPIDIAALDADGRVIDQVVAMKPWRLRWPRPGAVGVLELPAGCLERSHTRLGDRLALEMLDAGSGAEAPAR